MSELKTRFTAEDSGYQATMRRIRAWNKELESDIKRTIKASGIASNRNPVANPIFGELLPSEKLKRDILRQQLLFRKQLRDSQSKIPNLIFQDTPEESARKAVHLTSHARNAFKISGSRFGASSSMFISAARDTFASLASGMNPMTVFMQQAPQVAQGFAMMSRDALKAATRFLGWGAAVAAVGLGIWALVRHFKAIREELKNFTSLTDISTRTIANQINALKESAEVQREHWDWLRKHSNAQDDLAKAVDRAHESLKRKHQLEQEVARGKGDSPRKLAELELKQAKEELAFLKQAEAEAKANHAAAVERAKESAAAAEAFPKTDAGLTRDSAKKQLDEATQVADAIREKMAGQMFTEIDPEASSQARTRIYRTRPANASDKIEVEVNGKKYTRSLNEATAAVNELEQKSKQLADAEHGVKNRMTESAAEADKAKERADSLSNSVQKLESEIGLSEEISSQLSGKRRGGEKVPNVNERQRHGAYIGTPQTMVDQQRVTNSLLTQIRDRFPKPGSNLNQGTKF